MTTIETTHGTVRAQIDGPRADVVLDRPDVLNAMSGEMMADVIEIFDVLADRTDVWCATLTGEGRAFCVGADQKERRTMSDADVRRRRRVAPQVFSAMRSYPHPVVARVNGHALGGGFEMVLGCDLAVASEDATMGLVETTRGTIPGGGGARALVHLVGTARARELIYTGRRLTGAEAAALGVVTESVPAAELDATVDALVERILRNAPVAVGQAKKVLRLVEDASYEDGMRIEAEHYERILASTDRLEALAAYKEDRAPRFTGE